MRLFQELGESRWSTIPFGPSVDHEPHTEDQANRYGDPSTPSAAIQKFKQRVHDSKSVNWRSGCPIRLRGHPGGDGPPDLVRRIFLNEMDSRDRHLGLRW